MQLEVGSSCQKETQARPTTTPRLERGDREWNPWPWEGSCPFPQHTGVSTSQGLLPQHIPCEDSYNSLLHFCLIPPD